MPPLHGEGSEFRINIQICKRVTKLLEFVRSILLLSVEKISMTILLHFHLEEQAGQSR